MIFVIALPASLADVRYRWLAAGVLGSILSAGITQVGTFPLFRIDAAPPTGAEELIVFDTNDATNFSLAHYSAAGSGSALTVQEIVDGILDEQVSEHLDAGSAGAKLNAAGNAGDPWSTDLPGSYGEHTAGKILSRIDLDPPDAPVIVIPGAPSDLSLCRVYGYLETIDNKPAANVKIGFILQSPHPTKSERMISGRALSVTTDAQGRLIDLAGNPYVDLQRNDNLTPAESNYKVVCKELLLDATITLTTDLFDLASVIA